MTEGEFAPFIEGLIRAEEHDGKSLRPCPFCGHDEELHIRYYHGFQSVECMWCGVKVIQMEGEEPEQFWNRRAENKPKVPFGITINGDIGYECPYCKAVYSVACLPKDKMCEFCHKDMRVKE